MINWRSIKEIQQETAYPNSTSVQQALLQVWNECVQADYKWKEYDKLNPDTFPKEYGRYLIYRKGCDKVQFETWNGYGWAYNNNDCTHWKPIIKPLIP